MTGISSNVYTRLVKTLLKCGPFDSDEELRAVFIDARINPWYALSSQAQNAAIRVKSTIEALHNRYNDNQENALVLFLYVLSGQTPSGTMCYQELNRIAIELEQQLNIDNTGVAQIDKITGNYYAGRPISIPAAAPAPPPHFIGRQAELDALVQAFTDGSASQVIIALQGMGGIGKTALAAQLIATLRGAFPGGCFWADLATHNGDPFPVLEGWGRLCGLKSVGQSGDPVSVVRAILAANANRRGRLLVVLDDVRPAWLDAADVLKSALPTQASLLLTTRDEEIALALDARVHRLDVLSSQPASEMLQSYIGGRTGRCDPHDLQALMKRLGCLPLALKLAGKLVARFINKPGWSLQVLLAKIEEEPTTALELKNRGVHSAFSISYEDLTPEQQRLFRWLGIFAPGSFATAWVLRVLEWDQGENGQRIWGYRLNQGNAEHQEHVEEQLDELVALSLVQWADDGYRLHPLLRDYARTELRRAEEYEAATRAHSKVFLGLCRAQRGDYDALERARTNILMGMDAAFEREDWASVRGYMWGLGPDGRYMVALGYWQELRLRLSQALTAARAEGRERDVAAFTLNLGIAAQRLRDFSQAWQAYKTGLELGRRLNDGYIVARALHQLGMLAQVSGDQEGARSAYLASLDIKERLVDPRGLANSLAQLGTLAQAQSNYEEADKLYTRSLALFTQLDNLRGMAAVRHQMGSVALAQKHFDAAEAAYRESLSLWENIHDKRGIAAVRHQLGKLAQLQRDYDRARAEYEASLGLKRELGDEHGVGVTESNLATIAYVDGDFITAIQRLERAIAVFRQTSDREGEATAHYQAGLAAQALGDEDAAKDAYASSLALFQKLGNARSVSRVQVALEKLNVSLGNTID